MHEIRDALISGEADAEDITVKKTKKIKEKMPA